MASMDYNGCKEKKMKKRITATDALFGFGVWLTTRKEIVTFSHKHDTGKMVDLIGQFLKTNNLPNVSKNYPGNFITPEEEPIREEVSVARAVKVLTGSIREDEELRIGYQANIAMAVVDECKGTVGFEDIPYDTLHQAANKAADRFLTNWCYDSNK